MDERFERCPQCDGRPMQPRPVIMRNGLGGRDNRFRILSDTDSLQLWQCPRCHYVLLSDLVRYE